MADMEKVIKAIDICLGHGVCNDCPYCFSGKGYTTMNCRDYMLRDALKLLKEQEAKEQISDAIHETAKQFRQTIVRCKDCDNRECDGRAGTIVCGITGFSHSRLWFCADGERRRK